MTAGRPAVFLDRDGTLVRDTDHLRRPDEVELIPGAAEAVAALNAAGIPVAVITNQSGIARGIFTEAEYEAVRARIGELLAARGARIDGTWHCPHLPEISGSCECRKPGVLLYRRAADELGLDPARSAFIGDRWRDVAPAVQLGGRGYLVPSEATPADERAKIDGVSGIRVVATIGDAIADAFGLTAGGAAG